MAKKKTTPEIAGDVVLVVDAIDDDMVEQIVDLFRNAVGDNEIGIIVAVAQPGEGAEGDAEDGDAEGGYTEEDLNAMSLADLKSLAEEAEIDPLPKGKAKLVAAILEAQEGDDDEGEEEGDGEDDLDALGEAADEEDEDAIARLTELAEEAELDPDEYKSWALLAEALAGEGEAEEDEPEELDEDALNEMSPAELKKVAKEQGVTVKAGMKKAAIIEAIMETAEEE